MTVMILKAPGSSTKLEVALTRTPLAQDDIVLLCQGGRHGVVDDATIAETPARSAPNNLSRRLARRARLSRLARLGGPSLSENPTRRIQRYATTCVSIAIVSSIATRSCGDCARNCSIFGIFWSASSSSLSEPFAYAPSITRSRLAS